MYVYQDEVSSPQKKLENVNLELTDKSVLELGCNVGKLGVYALKRGAKSYTGVDTDEEVVKLGKKRYGLDLRVADAEDIELEADVIIAMALFHHFDDDKVERIIDRIECKELVFEVPVGDHKGFDLYYCRTQDWYRELIESKKPRSIQIVKSGATNDPWNERMVYLCNF